MLCSTWKLSFMDGIIIKANVVSVYLFSIQLWLPFDPITLNPFSITAISIIKASEVLPHI